LRSIDGDGDQRQWTRGRDFKPAFRPALSDKVQSVNFPEHQIPAKRAGSLHSATSVESSAGASNEDEDAATAGADTEDAEDAAAAEEPGKAAEELAAAIEAAFSEALNDPGSAYDSHLAPGQRIAWVERLEGAPDLPSEGAPAWGLMANRAKLEEAMTVMINEQLALARQYEATEQGQYEED
jgi:hypothetical protein